MNGPKPARPDESRPAAPRLATSAAGHLLFSANSRIFTCSKSHIPNDVSQIISPVCSSKAMARGARYRRAADRRRGQYHGRHRHVSSRPADNAVRESQERIRAAFENCSYKMSGKKVVVNLSPADIRKEGSAYDLTIALGILAATEQLPAGKALAVYRDGRAVARRLGAARARSPCRWLSRPATRDSRA